MNVDRRKRAAGILFMAAGGAFFAAAAAAHQPSFYGVGATFIGVSAAFPRAGEAAQAIAPRDGRGVSPATVAS